MGRITSLFARKVVDAIDGPSDRRALLETLGLEEGQQPDPSFMVPADAYYTFFEQAAAADSDPTSFPVRVGSSMRADEFRFGRQERRCRQRGEPDHDGGQRPGRMKFQHVA